MINNETVKDISSDNLMEIKRVVDNELVSRGHLLYQSHAIRPKLRTFDMGVEKITPRVSAPDVHKPTMAEFIEEGLELRRTAKDHMMAAEEERLTMEQRFIPWVGGIEVGTSMVLALKHETVSPARAAWILLLQNLRAGSMIAIVHPDWGQTQSPVPVESVNFYDKDKGWENVVMLIEVKDPAKPDLPAVKFYTSLNDELLDEHMVPVVNHEWIKIQPVSE